MYRCLHIRKHQPNAGNKRTVEGENNHNHPHQSLRGLSPVALKYARHEVIEVYEKIKAKMYITLQSQAFSSSPSVDFSLYEYGKHQVKYRIGGLKHYLVKYKIDGNVYECKTYFGSDKAHITDEQFLKFFDEEKRFKVHLSVAFTNYGTSPTYLFEMDASGHKVK